MGIFNSLFGKKQREEVITQIPESWKVLSGENNGNPMLVRKNAGCDTIAGNRDYFTSCGIAFKLLSPNAEGLPDIKSEPALNDIEDDIFDSFESDLNSIIPLVISTSGFREFVAYTKDLAEFEKRLNALRKRYPDYELSTYNKPDSNWETYKSFD